MKGKDKLIELIKYNEKGFAFGIGNGCGCPSEVGLDDIDCNDVDCNNKDCVKCWENALEKEYE